MRVLQTRQSVHRQLATAEHSNEQLSEQLQQAQRLSGLGLAWSITAHEVNNLLTPMVNYARLALQYPNDAELNKKALSKTILLGQRAGEILEKIMAMASGKKFDKNRLDVNALLDDVLVCIGRDFSKDGIFMVRDCQSGMTVRGDGLLLGQVIMNLILNARRAMRSRGGELKFSARLTPGGAVIEVSDNGCGMTREIASQIFEPFYSASGKTGERDGNGLGLVFCKQIIEAHGGSIQVESVPEQGTMFRILLPNY